MVAALRISPRLGFGIGHSPKRFGIRELNAEDGLFYGIHEPIVWGVRARVLAALVLKWLPSPAPKPM